MNGHLGLRSQRWVLRRLARQERRRHRPGEAGAGPRITAVVSVVDGYCDVLGPVCNDDVAGAIRGPARPTLVVVQA